MKFVWAFAIFMVSIFILAAIYNFTEIQKEQKAMAKASLAPIVVYRAVIGELSNDPLRAFQINASIKAHSTFSHLVEKSSFSKDLLLSDEDRNVRVYLRARDASWRESQDEDIQFISQEAIGKQSLEIHYDSGGGSGSNRSSPQYKLSVITPIAVKPERVLKCLGVSPRKSDLIELRAICLSAKTGSLVN